jgi:hypothetical protein
MSPNTPNADLERKSSAITLSDMEMFIFPELIYSLVLANIMSPRIWRWRDDPWFAGLDRMKPYRRITRLKQYIMDHYAFNLDLDTWGLTTKEKELARFRDFIDEQILKRSNALFGYEGDKYYFDIDIRTHFGLDKYEGNIIPYWKTETVEAMDAFRHKPNYGTGAGECVSLSTLYAAAMFVVAGIPLKDIYLMATPLHSQNFIDIGDGILTNNRRLVTKNMWFNGTPLSAQARRALENERVTIVTHETGYVHTVYPDATINQTAYRHCQNRLSDYLKVKFTYDIFGNFLRNSRDIQKCFQVRWPLHGTDHYIPAERVLAYEHGSPYQLTDNTRDKLMGEIDNEEFSRYPIPNRIVLNDLETFVIDNSIDLDTEQGLASLKSQFHSSCLNRDRVVDGLLNFCHVKPNLPDTDTKTFMANEEPLGIDPDMTRDEIISRLEDIRERNSMARLAFYAYRDLARTEAEPFMLAAVQRNPVSVKESEQLTEDTLLSRIREMPDESIYDEPTRFAQPDEVWNYGRGNGFEKAVLLANILRNRRPDEAMSIRLTDREAVLDCPSQQYPFPFQSPLNQQTWTI